MFESYEQLIITVQGVSKGFLQDKWGDFTDHDEKYLQ